VPSRCGGEFGERNLFQTPIAAIPDNHLRPADVRHYPVRGLAAPEGRGVEKPAATFAGANRAIHLFTHKPTGSAATGGSD
jgi:hypothetical protein